MKCFQSIAFKNILDVCHQILRLFLIINFPHPIYTVPGGTPCVSEKPPVSFQTYISHFEIDISEVQMSLDKNLKHKQVKSV